ncbi:MAG: hypothetical protein FJ280_04480 [Planctomycetes bacterium]|nr:hypothetical protein [Planctomycetota bacterium]
MIAVLPFLLDAIAFAQMLWPDFLSVERTYVTTVSAAFFGAAAAFALEVWRRKREEVESRHASLFKSQLVLHSQLNSLLNIKIQHLDEFRANPSRFLNLPQFISGHTEQRIDPQSIWFLPLLTRNMDAMNSVVIADLAYGNSIDVLTRRNQTKKRIETSPRSKVMTSIRSVDNTADVLMDQRDLLDLKGITDGLYECVDEAIKLQENAMSDLCVVIKQCFPGRMSMKGKGYSAQSFPEAVSPAVRPPAP